MPKRYWWIIITYIVCQFSAFILLTPILDFIPAHQRFGVWTVFSFVVALCIILLLLRPERHLDQREKRVTGKEAVLWSLFGIFLIYFAQVIAGIVDISLFGAPSKSENTEQIMKLMSISPYLVVVIAIVGPILEEIIFRKIIFGSLYRKTNFWIAALVSSLLFAAAHRDGHILIYGTIGLTLAYLYMKTRRIIVPIIAHAALNSIAVIITFSPVIQKLIEEQNVPFIGGF